MTVKCMVPGCDVPEFENLVSLKNHVVPKHGVKWKAYREAYIDKKPDGIEIEEEDEDLSDEVKPKKDVPTSLSPKQINQIVSTATAEAVKTVDEKMKGFETQIGMINEQFKRFNDTFGMTPPQGVDLIEQVSVEGTRIKYTVSLDPEMFYWHKVFLAQNKRLAQLGKAELWQGDFSDFLAMAVKDLLTRYGIHPTVLTYQKGTMIFELPEKREETS